MFIIELFMKAVKQDKPATKTWEELVKMMVFYLFLGCLLASLGVIYANYIREPSGNTYNYYTK
jgi:hypothetical protein